VNARLRALAMLLACSAGPARGEPVAYRLDPDHTFVWFEVVHFGTSTLRGRFGRVQGSVELDAAAGRGNVSLRIPTASLDTGIRLVDTRLCERDLLGCADDPEAFFVADRVSFEGGRVAAVRGELTLRGRTQSITLRARRFGCRDDHLLQREVCGGDFESELLRADFGVDYGIAFVTNRVVLRIQVEGVRQGPGAPGSPAAPASATDPARPASGSPAGS